MINSFRIVLRGLWKNKVPSFINLFGLTTGLCACLLIAMYIMHHYGYDDFQPNKDRIARVIMSYRFDGGSEGMAGNFTSTKVAPVFSRTFPEVESAIRMTRRDVIVRYKDSFFKEANFVFADSTFFKMFAFTMLEGDPRTALDGPRKIVLTKSAARKYFNNESPVGKTLLLYTNEDPYEVTGVVADYPENSQLKFDFLGSFSSLKANQEETYFEANYTTYLLLRDAPAIETLQAKLGPFMEKEMAGTGASINYFLEPFKTIHLHSPYAGFVPTVSADFLLVLGGVAALILVIVCFTYINLSTARAVERAREVGVRKVVGAGRLQLFWQFIGESVIVSAVAIIISVALVCAVLPYFNQLTGQKLSVDALISLPLIACCIALLAFVSLLAGSYPAMVLSRLQTVRVLKGSFKSTTTGRGVQQFLIVFQFSVTMFLIVATFVIKSQLSFIQHHNLGFDRNHVVVLPMDKRIFNDLDNIKQALKNDHRILNVSRCTNTPVHIYGGYAMRNSLMAEGAEIAVNANAVDEDFIPATGLEVIAGTNFSEQDVKDVSWEQESEPVYHFILNESAALALGWTPEEAVGQKMFMGTHRAGFVRGVVKNFHFASLHDPIKPVILFPEHRSHGHLLVKVSGEDLGGALAFIESTWKQRVPYLPFESRFLDEDFQTMYRSELQLGSVMNIFSALAITLACLGLFGLSSFIGQQRMKEMSIRKVLGASFLHIMKLLSGKFLLLFVVSIAIALPFAYLMMNQWLQSFVYRVDVSYWLLLTAALVVVTVALLTVSIQAIKTSLVNPARTLKSD